MLHQNALWKTATWREKLKRKHHRTHERPPRPSRKKRTCYVCMVFPKHQKHPFGLRGEWQEGYAGDSLARKKWQNIVVWINCRVGIRMLKPCVSQPSWRIERFGYVKCCVELEQSWVRCLDQRMRGAMNALEVLLCLTPVVGIVAKIGRHFCDDFNTKPTASSGLRDATLGTKSCKVVCFQGSKFAHLGLDWKLLLPLRYSRPGEI